MLAVETCQDYHPANFNVSLHDCLHRCTSHTHRSPVAHTSCQAWGVCVFGWMKRGLSVRLSLARARSLLFLRYLCLCLSLSPKHSLPPFTHTHSFPVSRSLAFSLSRSISIALSHTHTLCCAHVCFCCLPQSWEYTHCYMSVPA